MCRVRRWTAAAVAGSAHTGRTKHARNDVTVSSLVLLFTHPHHIANNPHTTPYILTTFRLQPRRFIQTMLDHKKGELLSLPYNPFNAQNVPHPAPSILPPTAPHQVETSENSLANQQL
jgi:hypothetical protein